MNTKGQRSAWAGSVAATAMATALAVASAKAQVAPNGGQFQVNAYTTNDQRIPAVALDAQGNFVVAWGSDGSSGGDTDGYSIQAQRYAAGGVSLGDEFQVNSYASGDQSAPAVAADGQGNFVVVWVSYGSSGNDTDGLSIQAQRYGAGGVPLGSQFQVNTYTSRHQYCVAVAADAQGSFVVVWTNRGWSGGDTSYASIQAQRYDADGVPLGDQFQVNDDTTSDQCCAAVAVGAQGEFVVAWEANGSSGSDSSGWSIQARRYDAAGLPLGGQFQVNTYTTSSQVYAGVAVNGQGNFVVVWTSWGSSGGDTSSWSIQAQRYDAGGLPLGGEFQVNTYTTNYQILPDVAADAKGEFTVVWLSSGSSGSDTQGVSIQAQRYDASGLPLGGEFQVNTYTSGNQWSPAVAADAQGNFVVAWESYGSSGGDTDGYSIQAQRYDGLFRDGFESGDSSRWSFTVP